MFSLRFRRERLTVAQWGTNQTDFVFHARRDTNRGGRSESQTGRCTSQCITRGKKNNPRVGCRGTRVTYHDEPRQEEKRITVGSAQRRPSGRARVGAESNTSNDFTPLCICAYGALGKSHISTEYKGTCTYRTAASCEDLLYGSPSNAYVR